MCACELIKNRNAQNYRPIYKIVKQSIRYGSYTVYITTAELCLYGVFFVVFTLETFLYVDGEACLLKFMYTLVEDTFFTICTRH